MAAASKSVTHTPVLIVGGGPVGLGLAADLGWRGVACTVVEQGDGSIAHPRATAENARTMELFRRWGIAERVKEAGTPPDFPHTVLYLTSLTGYEIARIDRPGHGGTARTAISPERPQRCNQLWLDPILRDFATSFPTVTLEAAHALRIVRGDGRRHRRDRDRSRERRNPRRSRPTTWSPAAAAPARSRRRSASP